MSAHAAVAGPSERASARVHALPPIGLDELVERAALQTRVDRKYVVPAAELDGILAEVAALPAEARVLEMAGIRAFRYESVYFDTPELTSYWMAARARRRRVKMRTRSYVDSGTAFLEVKTKGARSATVKDRLAYDFADRARLNHDGLDYLGAALDDGGFDEVTPTALVPTLVTRYHRTTLFVPGDEHHAESRATIDTDLDWERDPAHRIQTPGIVIVETKSGSRASAVDRILWDRGHRPSTLSKYGTGLAALRPDLASNKWSRTLRRHFDTQSFSSSLAS